MKKKKAIPSSFAFFSYGKESKERGRQKVEAVNQN